MVLVDREAERLSPLQVLTVTGYNLYFQGNNGLCPKRIGGTYSLLFNV